MYLDIDQGNPYYAKEDGRDWFFRMHWIQRVITVCQKAEAGYGCICLPNEKAIAVNAVRMAGEQADRILNPEKESFLNCSGVGVELTLELSDCTRSRKLL